VQVLGEGMRFVDDQLPARALMPVAVGPRVLLCSNSKQAVDDTATTDTAAISASFFIMSIPQKSNRGARSPPCSLYRAEDAQT
jgi:hypothetical protein